MSLVIIESPNKIKKLRSILGNNYRVVASIGHIKNLSRKKLGIDDKYNPVYVTLSDKKTIVSDLKKEAKCHDDIYIATDPDREGEAIAFHIKDIVEKSNKKASVYRIKFNAITKADVLSAMKNVSKFDQNLYSAQKARRVADRIFGFKISSAMWGKGLRGASAGRVQSVALKIIADREKEINAFVPEKYHTIECILKDGTSLLYTSDNGERVKSKADANKIKKEVLKASSGKVKSFSSKNKNKKPYGPFTTSTLQQAANSFFSWTSKKIMNVAQSLFGKGLITYHRTDSERTDPQKISSLRKNILNSYGKNYLSGSVRAYGAKSSSQDAHEAIRPTYDTSLVTLSPDEDKLLNLIDSRFKASQMADFVYSTSRVDIEFGGHKFFAKGASLVFDGFTKVYPISVSKNMIPAYSTGQSVKVDKVIVHDKETMPPKRYSDASIVNILEKQGVGRPSTYASIIEKLVEKKFCERNKNILKSTKTGIIISDYLSDSYPHIVDKKFTSTMENKLDDISKGSLDYYNVLKSLDVQIDNAVSVAIKDISPKSLIENKDCPKCGSKTMVRRISKNGPFLGCSNWPSCDGTISLGDKKVESVETGEPCPSCGNILMLRDGKSGKFYGCKGYPTCKYTKPFISDDAPDCPKCSSKLVKRKGKYGMFYGCSSYPKCKHMQKIKKKS